MVLRHVSRRAPLGGVGVASIKCPAVGSRVHWIVVRDGHVTNRRLAGGAGMGLDYALGAGPEAAAAHWEDRGELTGWWTDDVCDGGALIDADRQVLLFFTTRALPAYRTAMLDGYRRVWAGWQVAWADAGLVELARYVGVDPAAVRTPAAAKLLSPEPDAPTAPDVQEALGVLAGRVETFVPADIGLRAMKEKLQAGLGARVALAAMESARDEAAPAAAAAARLIRER
jgi:hypothetical protein